MQNQKNLKDCDSFYSYIAVHYDKDKNNFVLIDEIPMCKDFEKVINCLHAEENYFAYCVCNLFLL